MLIFTRCPWITVDTCRCVGVCVCVYTYVSKGFGTSKLISIAHKAGKGQAQVEILRNLFGENLCVNYNCQIGAKRLHNELNLQHVLSRGENPGRNSLLG